MCQLPCDSASTYICYYCVSRDATNHLKGTWLFELRDHF